MKETIATVPTQDNVVCFERDETLESQLLYNSAEKQIIIGDILPRAEWEEANEKTLLSTFTETIEKIKTVEKVEKFKPKKKVKVIGKTEKTNYGCSGDTICCIDTDSELTVIFMFLEGKFGNKPKRRSYFNTLYNSESDNDNGNEETIIESQIEPEYHGNFDIDSGCTTECECESENENELENELEKALEKAEFLLNNQIILDNEPVSPSNNAEEKDKEKKEEELNDLNENTLRVGENLWKAGKLFQKEKGPIEIDMERHMIKYGYVPENEMLAKRPLRKTKDILCDCKSTIVDPFISDAWSCSIRSRSFLDYKLQSFHHIPNVKEDFFKYFSSIASKSHLLFLEEDPETNPLLVLTNAFANDIADRLDAKDVVDKECLYESESPFYRLLPNSVKHKKEKALELQEIMESNDFGHVIVIYSSEPAVSTDRIVCFNHQVYIVQKKKDISDLRTLVSLRSKRQLWFSLDEYAEIDADCKIIARHSSISYEGSCFRKQDSFFFDHDSDDCDNCKLDRSLNCNVDSCCGDSSSLVNQECLLDEYNDMKPETFSFQNNEKCLIDNEVVVKTQEEEISSWMKKNYGTHPKENENETKLECNYVTRSDTQYGIASVCKEMLHYRVVEVTPVVHIPEYAYKQSEFYLNAIKEANLKDGCTSAFIRKECKMLYDMQILWNETFSLLPTQTPLADKIMKERFQILFDNDASTINPDPVLNLWIEMVERKQEAKMKKLALKRGYFISSAPEFTFIPTSDGYISTWEMKSSKGFKEIIQKECIGRLCSNENENTNANKIPASAVEIETKADHFSVPFAKAAVAKPMETNMESFHVPPTAQCPDFRVIQVPGVLTQRRNGPSAFTTFTISDTSSSTERKVELSQDGEILSDSKLIEGVKVKEKKTNDYALIGYKSGFLPNTDRHCIIGLGMDKDSKVTSPMSNETKLRTDCATVLFIVPYEAKIVSVKRRKEKIIDKDNSNNNNNNSNTKDSIDSKTKETVDINSHVDKKSAKEKWIDSNYSYPTENSIFVMDQKSDQVKEGKKELISIDSTIQQPPTVVPEILKKEGKAEKEPLLKDLKDKKEPEKKKSWFLNLFSSVDDKQEKKPEKQKKENDKENKDKIAKAISFLSKDDDYETIDETVVEFDFEKEYESASSIIDPNYIYTLGKTVKEEQYDPDQSVVCTKGIHFFLTQQDTIRFGFGCNSSITKDMIKGFEKLESMTKVEKKKM